MSYDPADTIVAVASPAGPAARGILRISGPHVLACLTASFTPDDGSLLAAARQARCFAGNFLLDDAQRELPADLYLWPGHKSYTREPLAELHTLGSPPLLEAALRALCRHGARPAEPGEFTLRAFLAGRLDLTQAEAVLGVIDAQSRRDLDAALAQLAGGLKQRLAELRDELLDLLAELEAGLDFVEEDIEFITPEALATRLDAALVQLADLAAQWSSRTRHDSSPRVVLAGSPNVGKSSLFNALAGDASAQAIISEVPGTTRDWLTCRLELDELVCTLIDSAGAEAATAGPASLAQSARETQLAQAHLVLFCLDSTRPVNDWERAQLERSDSSARLIVLTKADRPSSADYHGPAIHTSAAAGMGLDMLRQAIRESLATTTDVSGVVAATAARSRESIRLACESIQRARDLVQDRHGEELIASEVRVAIDELGKVVGAVYTDDLLDRIFSRFCIGK